MLQKVFLIIFEVIVIRYFRESFSVLNQNEHLCSFKVSRSSRQKYTVYIAQYVIVPSSWLDQLTN